MKAKKKPTTISVNIRFNSEEYRSLKNLVDYYRSKSLSHAIRLAVEDVAKRVAVEVAQ